MEIDRDILSVVGTSTYEDVLKPTFREVVVAYINVERGCAGQQGNTVRPVGGTPAEGKLLKIRLGVPGRGKSGSLRILFQCTARNAVATFSWPAGEGTRS